MTAASGEKYPRLRLVESQFRDEAADREPYRRVATPPKWHGPLGRRSRWQSGVVRCFRSGCADINVTAAAVRRIDSSLTGGKPVFGGNEDMPAVDLAWVAVGTLCTGGVNN
jgi:hypothetical protein